MECIACYEPDAGYDILCGSPVKHVMCETCEIDWRLKMKYGDKFELSCPLCRVSETELNPNRTLKSMECELKMLRSVRERAHHRVSLNELVMPSCVSIRAKTYPPATSNDFTRFALMKRNIIRDIDIRRQAALRPAAVLRPAAPTPRAPTAQAVVPRPVMTWAGIFASMWAEHLQLEVIAAASPQAAVQRASVQRVQVRPQVRPRRVKCESGKPCTTRSKTQRKCDRCDKRVCRSCKECLTH